MRCYWAALCQKAYRCLVFTWWDGKHLHTCLQRLPAPIGLSPPQQPSLAAVASKVVEVTLEQLAMLPSGENELWSGLWQERRCAWGVLPCLRDLSLASRMARDCCPHCRQVFSFSCGLGWPHLPVLLGTSCCSPDKAWLSSGSWKDSTETASLVFFTRKTAIESFKRLNNNACSRSVSLTAKYCGENNTPSLSCL